MKPYLLLFRDLVKRLGWRLPVLVAWTVLVGLGEGVAVVLLLPLLSRIGIAVSSNQGVVISQLDRGLTLIGATSPLTILAVIVAIVAIQTMLSVVLIWWTAILARRYQSQRQLELFDALMRAKWNYLADKKVAR